MTSQRLLGGDSEGNILSLYEECRFQVRETEQRGVDATPTSLTAKLACMHARGTKLTISTTTEECIR